MSIKNKDFRYTFVSTSRFEEGQHISIITPERKEVSGTVTKVVYLENLRWKVTIKTYKPIKEVEDSSISGISSTYREGE